MGFYATASECERRAKTYPPAKNRVWNFSEPSPLHARQSASQVLDLHLEKQPKPTIIVSGVRYYGYRYLHPELGRFISRDPIGEMGGVNVYVFVRNNSVMYADYLGTDIVDVTRAARLIEALRAVDGGRGFGFFGLISDDCELLPLEASSSPAAVCDDCGSGERWTCIARLKCVPVDTEGIIRSTQWEPPEEQSALHQEIFAHVYASLLEHEQQHRKIFLRHLRKLRKTYVESSSGCTKDTACTGAKEHVEANHILWVARVSAENWTEQTKWDETDYQERSAALNRVLRRFGIDYRFEVPERP